MASGRLGTADLSASTITDVYTAPASILASVNLSICNRNAIAAVVRVALSDTTAAQGVDEYIEYDVEIPAKGVLERTGITLAAAQIITVYSDTANVSVVVSGIEESA